MVAPFIFLDRIDALVGDPGNVLATVRALVRPGGDRAICYEADRVPRFPPQHDVEQHVRDVALDVVTERVREGLVAALAEHFAAVREECEMLGDDYVVRAVDSLWDGDAGKVLDRKSDGWRAIVAGTLAPLQVADALLSGSVEDPAAVLARVGVTSEALEAIADELCVPKTQDWPSGFVTPSTAPSPFEQQERLAQEREMLSDGENSSSSDETGWSIEWFGTYLLRYDDKVTDLTVEGVAYVLTEPDMIDTGAELLGLAGDAAFLEWARDRLMFSTPEEDAAAVAEVLRLAGATEKGGGASDVRFDENRQPETAAGVDEGPAPAAQFECVESGGCAPPVYAQKCPELRKREAPVAAELSDLTRAVSAALAALFDHGCETDKAIAAALGVERSVVAGARKGTAPWAPDVAQCSKLYGMLLRHVDPLETARVTLAKEIEP